MPFPFRLAVLAAPLALAACGGSAPFLDYYPPRGDNVVPMMGSEGVAAVCHGSESPSSREIKALAAAHCAEIGMVPSYDRTERYRCAASAPNVSYFNCVPPKGGTVARELAPRERSVSVPPPAWVPGGEAPPAPEVPSATPTADPWSPGAMTPPAAAGAAPTTTSTAAPATPGTLAPSWDLGSGDASAPLGADPIGRIPRF